MSGGIFLVRSDDELVEMREAPYENEDILQALIAKFPSLLAGDQFGADVPRRWLLVGREKALPDDEDSGGRWSVDHLFLDQDAVPTLVEVKRSSDTRIRREVVGQMLDYAANGVVYWPLAELREFFARQCERSGRQPEELVAQVVGPEADVEMFWDKVGENLRAGKVRMVFISDEIPRELRRVVEFLNGQMSPAEVIAIEVKQYLSSEGTRTLVPRLVGRTEEAQQRKGQPAKRKWDETSFLVELANHSAPADLELAKAVMAWAKDQGLRLAWGSGSISGSCFAVLDHAGEWYAPVALWTNGRVEVQFDSLRRRPPFDDEGERRELLERLNGIPGIALPADALNRLPSFPMSLITPADSTRRFIATLEWFFERVRGA